MYIRKSVLSGMVMLAGGLILAVVAILFCFTEITVPRYVYIAVWAVCIWSVPALIKRIEQTK